LARVSKEVPNVVACTAGPHERNLNLEVPMGQMVDVAELETVHASLERQIDEEVHRPLPDQIHLTELKREKLKVKEELARRAGYS
jgi:hypothetical protein